MCGDGAVNQPIKPLFSGDEIAAFQALRQATFSAIARKLRFEPHCKTYEGTWEIHLPNHFETSKGDDWVKLKLWCYVIVPSRCYEWEGATLGTAVERALVDVEKWAEEVAEEERENDAADA